MDLTEKKLLELVKDCIKEIEALGYDVPKNIIYKVNTRYTSRLGNCRTRRKEKDFVISISKNFASEVGEKEVKNTIIHEILHTFEGGRGHGEKWKVYANEMNKAYGYNIKRTNENPYSNKNVKYRYKLVCKDCGHYYMYQRRIDPKKYICGKCKGKLELIPLDSKIK